MKQLLLIMIVTLSLSKGVNAQISKKDSVMVDSLIVSTLNAKFKNIGNYLSDKLTKGQWEIVMAELNNELLAAIIEVRKKIIPKQ